MPCGQPILTDKQRNEIIKSITNLRNPISDKKKTESIEYTVSLYLKQRNDLSNWLAKRHAEELIKRYLNTRTNSKNYKIPEIVIINKKDCQIFSDGTESYRFRANEKNCDHSTLFKKWQRFQIDTTPDTTQKQKQSITHCTEKTCEKQETKTD